MIDFVNTLDLEDGSDELSSPAELAAWLAGRRLLAGAEAEISAGEHARALALREALRALMLAHNGGPEDDRACETLEDAACAGELGVHFAGGGEISLRPKAPGVAGALAGLLVPVAAGSSDGSWRRVKACRAEDCQWAFYDRSRNRAATWCEMAVCGNRTKVRAYRERAPRRTAGRRAPP